MLISSQSWLHPDYSLLSHVIQVTVISPAEIRLHLHAPIFKAIYVGDARSTIKRALRACFISRAKRQSVVVVNKHMDVKWEIMGYYTEDDDDEEKSTLRACFDVQEEEDAARDIYLVAITEKSGTEGLVLAKDDNGFYSRLGSFYAAGSVRKLFQDKERTEVILI
jgi:hypothetical protein